jgi:hypothetical protein
MMSHINPGPVCPVDVGSGSAGGGISVEAEDKNAGVRKDGAQGKTYDVRCEKENTEVVGQTQTIGA